MSNLKLTLTQRVEAMELLQKQHDCRHDQVSVIICESGYVYNSICCTCKKPLLTPTILQTKVNRGDNVQNVCESLYEDITGKK